MSSPPPVLGKRRSNRAAVFTTATLAVTAQGKYCKHCTAEEAQQFSWVVKGLVQVVHHRHSHHAASSGSYRTEHVLQAVQAEQAQYVSQAGLMVFLFDTHALLAARAFEIERQRSIKCSGDTLTCIV